MNYPGYVYDEHRHCYFRVPPKHYKQFSQYDTTADQSSHSNRAVEETSRDSLHNFLQKREISLKRVHSLRVLNEYVIADLKKEGGFEFTDIPPTSQCNDILINKSGDMCAMQCTSGGNTLCRLYSLKSRRTSHKELWRTDSVVTPVQGFYSMAFTADGSHFFGASRNLNSNSVSVCNFLNSIPKQQPSLKLSRGATCMALHANSCHWHVAYLAVCHHNGNIHIYNREHRLTCKTSQLKSSILSTAFSSQDPLLFAGCRNGTCFVWDTRMSSLPVMSVKEPPVESKLSSSMICLHPLQDHNYFISNALNSKLSMWDLRMQRKVLLFRGHVNEYKSCKSIMDTLGSSLAAVGSDGTVRVWSTRTGTMLCCLYEEQACGLPHITYFSSFGGPSGKPGLLVAHNNAVSIYHV